MITLPTAKEMKELEDFQQSRCLTIYMPRIDPNASENPNRIELKNLLRDGEMALTAAGATPQEIDQALAPARQLMDGHEFWPAQRESLALFMHPKLFHCYHTPTDVTPRAVIVETGFNLQPLRQMIDENRSYFVLSLGHKNVRLYEGNRYELAPVELAKLPTNLEEALRIDEYPESRESHSVAPAGSGRESEVSHGQYDASETDKILLLEFFRKIDRHLHDFLRAHQKPLVIAGVGRLLPMYRKVNNYPNLLEGDIAGNQEHTPPKQLHEKAWTIVKQLNVA